MKAAIFSDTHLGYGQGLRKDEAEENFKKATEIALSQNPDFIILPGDLFDSKVPEQEVIAKALDLYKIFWKAKSSVEVFVNGEKVNYKGVPVLAIHGTHERRLREYTNVLELLEKSDRMIYLRGDRQKAFILKDEEEAFIYGFSAVPDDRASEVLRLLNPKPESKCNNIFVFHQTIKEYVPEEPNAISLNDLPEGFDLLIDGHFHNPRKEIIPQGTLLFTGSTIVTQMKDGEKEKGVWFYDTKTKSLDFISLPNQRKVVYKILEFSEADKPKIMQDLEEVINRNLTKPEPMIHIKLRGKLEKGLIAKDLDLSEILKKYSDKAILNIEKDFTDFKERMETLRLEHSEKASISKIGLQLLKESLNKTNFWLDTEKLFELFAENKIDEAFEYVKNEKRKKVESISNKQKNQSI